MTSNRSTTRTLVVALAAAAALLFSATTVQADPPSILSSQTVTQEIGFAYCQFVACGNGGAGEWVSFTGTNTWISTIEHTADKRVIVTWKLSTAKATGTGIESGESYTSKKESTELIAVNFYSAEEAANEISANLHWRSNVEMEEGQLSVPLLFNGEITVDTYDKEMKFRFEEIETSCQAMFTASLQDE